LDVVFFASIDKSTNNPSTAAKTDASKIAILALSKTSGDTKDSDAMKVDIVKPIPASIPTPSKCLIVSPSGIVTILKRIAKYEKV
jgi:hypothetical protein